MKNKNETLIIKNKTKKHFDKRQINPEIKKRKILYIFIFNNSNKIKEY